MVANASKTGSSARLRIIFSTIRNKNLYITYPNSLPELPYKILAVSGRSRGPLDLVDLPLDQLSEIRHLPKPTECRQLAQIAPKFERPPHRSPTARTWSDGWYARGTSFTASARCAQSSYEAMSSSASCSSCFTWRDPRGSGGVRRGFRVGGGGIWGLMGSGSVRALSDWPALSNSTAMDFMVLSALRMSCGFGEF